MLRAPQAWNIEEYQGSDIVVDMVGGTRLAGRLTRSDSTGNLILAETVDITDQFQPDAPTPEKIGTVIVLGHRINAINKE